MVDRTSPLFVKGIAEFNEREFYECHETLEELWQEDRSAERELIQGIIQIAVGYYHYLRQNKAGAIKLLTRGLERLRKYEHSTLQLDIGKLSGEVSTHIEQIAKLDPDQFCPLNLPTIEPFPN